MNSIFLPAILLLSGFITFLIGITLYSIWTDERKSTAPKSEKYPDETETLDQTILHQAQKQANQLISEAELAGIERIAKRELWAKKVETVFDEDMKRLIQEALTQLIAATESIKQQYNRFTTESEQILTHHIEQNQDLLDEHVKRIVKANEDELSRYYKSLLETIKTSVSGELLKTNGIIRAYEDERKKLVDESLTDLIERTISMLFKDALTSEQMGSLVIDTLKKAQSDGFFGNKDLPNKL